MLAALAACTPRAPDPLGLPPVPLPARMVEVAAAPVAGPPPAAPPDRLLEARFEAGEAASWSVDGLMPQAKATGTVTVHDGHLVVAAGPLGPGGNPAGAMPSATFSVPARRGDVVRVRVRQRAVGLDYRGFPAEGAGLAVVERGGEERVHDRVARAYGTTPWQDASVEVRVGEGTTSLDVVLMAGPVLMGGAAWFDDLVVERLSREARTDASTHRVGGAAPDAGWFSASGELRPSLVARAPSRWAVGIPAEAARLTFGVARSRASQRDAELCWSAALAGGETLGRGCIGAGAADAWQDIAIDLPAGAGPRELHLSLDEEGGDAVGALGDPVVWPAAPAARPDLMLITVPGLRADDPMPALDALAGVGRRYTAATATSSFSYPALGSVLTGLLPYRHQAGASRRNLRRPRAWKQGLLEADPDRFTPLRGDARTVAERLGAAGYTTFGVASTPTVWPWRGLGRGLGRLVAVDRTPEAGEDPVTDAVAAWFTAIGPAGARPPTFVLAQVQDLVPPWRLDPARGPAPDGLPADETRGGTVLSSPDTLGRRHPEASLRLYADERARVDARVAALVAAVPAEAAVVVVGEYGTLLGEAELWGSGRAVAPAAVDVPLVVRAPGVPAGVEARPVSTAAVAPTLLQLAGLPPAEGLDATPLPPLGDAPALVFSEGVSTGAAELAVRAADARVRYAFPLGTDGPPDERLGIRGLPIGSDPEPRIEGVGDAARLDALVASLEDRIRRFEPGVHVTCEAGPAGRLEVAPDVAVTRAQVLVGGAAHALDIPGTHDRGRVGLVADTPLWLVLRVRDRPAEATLSLDGQPLRVGPLAPEPALAGDRCRMWLVAPPG